MVLLQYTLLLYYKLTKSCYFCLSESYFLIFRNRKNCIYFLFKSFSNFIIFSGRTKSNSSMVFFQPIENSFFTSCSRSASSIFYMKMSVFGILLWKIFFKSDLEYLIHSILFQNVKDVTALSLGLHGFG